MKGEVNWIFGLLVFLSFLGVMSLFVPEGMKVMNLFDFAWLGTGIIGVAGACAIATGIPCAAALAIFGVATLLEYIVVSNSIIKVLIFLPIIVTLIYIVSRLGRGGG